jgi:inner membrane protein
VEDFPRQGLFSAPIKLDGVDVASIFSHLVAALGMGASFSRPATPKRVWAAGAVCSVIPDLDVIGLRLGVQYGDFWGHRGFTHSLLSLP